MPRIARVVVPGVLHHITQRGNNRQDVFLTDDDREFYLNLLKKRSRQDGLEVLGYCLMTNHVHLLVRPAAAESLARTLGRTHFTYAQRFNFEHARSGHLWQSRYCSCPAEEGSRFAILRYIEQNPVRAGIVGHAWKYPWSSAAVHVGERTGSGLVDTSGWSRLTSPDDWRRFLQETEDPVQVAEIRRRTLVGRPFGSTKFVGRIEALLGRPLKPRPVGRPRGIGNR
jgi:REP-associated tyrosine transposase